MNSIAFKPQHRMALKHFRFLFVMTLVFLINACTNSSKDELTPPEGMSVVKLNTFGKPFAIFVPDTSKNPLSITEEPSGALLIKAGSSFAVAVYEEAADLELKRSDIKADEINKLNTFLSDEPNAIFWESAITEPEYHFLLNSSVGETTYSFQDHQVLEGKTPSKSAVQKMFDSCKNIKALK
ncbi:MAG: hypothetical protein MUF75_11020 [Bacteroidia bacterium]|jgi:hypothetical protein|nr:hypothetical protein [Bacteroidia bacterium]